ncbi:MAG: L-threonylcarbamoyladenylate synthase [Crocinitomicaceae bacterium]|jgi:tRNA threonylcarbamoyl adenosine modification protein (Sua5/YciO/YrdC/YwlC family)|tara:strand:+ start:24660 stop:25280 length:621 start_codon:yes stop_codon:yes gene_type:complete
MFFEINPNNIDARLITEAVKALKNGKIIIFPTDSVYAVGCDLNNKKALSQLAKFKGDKLNKVHFSIICKDFTELSSHTKHLNRPTFKLIKQHLPGPFTFILNANSSIPKLFDSKKKEIGVRITDNAITQALVAALGNPIASTSLHDEDEPLLEYYTDPYQIFETYENQIDIIIDGGIGKIEPSTIIDCFSQEEAFVVRYGAGKIDL